MFECVEVIRIDGLVVVQIRYRSHHRNVDQNPAREDSVFEGQDIIFPRSPSVDGIGRETVEELAAVQEMAQRIHMRGGAAVERRGNRVDGKAFRAPDPGAPHDVFPGEARSWSSGTGSGGGGWRDKAFRGKVGP